MSSSYGGPTSGTTLRISKDSSVVTIDFFAFSPASNPNSTKWGISVGIAFGGAYEAHGGSYFTKSTESWNPIWWWSGR